MRLWLQRKSIQLLLWRTKVKRIPALTVLESCCSCVECRINARCRIGGSVMWCLVTPGCVRFVIVLWNCFLRAFFLPDENVRVLPWR